VINWTVEKPLVETECALYGTNLLVPVLMAIRTAENGSSASLSLRQTTACDISMVCCATAAGKTLDFQSALSAGPAYVLTDEKGIAAIRNTIAKLNVVSTQNTEMNTVSVVDNGAGTIQIRPTPTTKLGIEGGSSLLLSGLSFVPVDAAKVVATIRTSQPSTFITETPAPSYLRYLSPSILATRIFLESAPKPINATCFVAIAMPSTINPNWQAISSGTSPLLLKTSSEGILIGECSINAGREYGVLSVSAPTYAEQLHMAALTVLHRLWSYPGNPLTTTPDHQLVVSTNWIAYFASIWAPSGVANDPNNLNANWVKDFTAAYNGFIAALLPAAP